MQTFLNNRNTPFRNDVLSSGRLTVPADLTPSIRSVTPSEIVNFGDVVVRVRGARLTADTQIFFNDIQGETVGFRGTFGGLEVRVPFDGSLVGPVTVRAYNPEAELTSEDIAGLLTVSFPVPVVTGVQPNVGSGAGGETVFLSGGFFFEGAEVYFGDQQAPEVRRFGPNADSTVLLEVTTPAGQGQVEVRVVNTQPGRSESIDSVTFTYESAEGFLRGDPDSSGDINLTDAVLVLNYLFAGGASPGCEAAGDSDRSGDIGLTDAIQILNYLFLGSDGFPAPFPECGQDPLGELLGCEATRACE
jgi:hypothetical protein